jgi:DNA-binding NtrC family response regulator
MTIIISGPRPPPQAGGHTVLIVEDNDHFRNAEAEALTSCGYKVLTGASTEEAVQILSDMRIDLLVTDIWLAGRPSGIALARAVKQSRPYVKVLIVSTDGDLLSSEDCRGIADSVLKKPFTRSELQERAASLVGARNSRQRSACA